jgi:hypothetical protein
MIGGAMKVRAKLAAALLVAGALLAAGCGGRAAPVAATS